MFSGSKLTFLRQLQTKSVPMTDLSSSPITLAMPEITGVTEPHYDLHYLKPEYQFSDTSG